MSNEIKSVGVLANQLFRNAKAQHKNQLPENLPYKFTKDKRPLTGEEFRKVCDYDLKYSCSNFGRVRNDIKGTILSPNRPEGTGKFYVRLINKEQTRVQDLIYRAFIGSIPKNMIVICKDGDRRNLTIDNLKLTKASHKRQYKRTTKREKLIPRAKAMQGMQKEQTISIEGLTGEEKAAQVKRLNELSKYYYTDTVKNGVYYLKLKNS
tara:strand:- start:26 stop:649 length:624 start_codon:yes stop_codon:yes gene_type:complete